MKDNLVVVIEEIDHEYHERSIIGVTTSVENAEALIDDYFGRGLLKGNKDYRHDLEFSDVVYEQEVEINYKGETWKSRIILTYFELNKA